MKAECRVRHINHYNLSFLVLFPTIFFTYSYRVVISIGWQALIICFSDAGSGLTMDLSR
jgi:hypothetical protein